MIEIFNHEKPGCRNSRDVVTYGTSCQSSSNVVWAGRPYENKDIYVAYGLGPGAVLTNVDLSDEDLSNVNFSNADMTDANLAGADLASSTLTRATLSGSNISAAQLKAVASVTGVDITGNDLTRFDLSKSCNNRNYWLFTCWPRVRQVIVDLMIQFLQEIRAELTIVCERCRRFTKRHQY